MWGELKRACVQINSILFVEISILYMRQVVLGLQKPLTVERGEKLVGEITLSPDFTQHRLTNYQTISDM